MSELNDVIRSRWPTVGSEEHVLWTFLDFERATLAMKCAGLSDEQLAARTCAPSNLCLLGLLRHMVEHEHYWYETIFLGRDSPAAFHSDDDADADFNALDSVPVTSVVDQWIAQCQVSRDIVKGRSLDERSVTYPDYLDAPVSLRFMVMHSVEEYARHCGHADLLRESIDGEAGY